MAKPLKTLGGFEELNRGDYPENRPQEEVEETGVRESESEEVSSSLADLEGVEGERQKFLKRLEELGEKDRKYAIKAEAEWRASSEKKYTNEGREWIVERALEESENKYNSLEEGLLMLERQRQEIDEVVNGAKPFAFVISEIEKYTEYVGWDREVTAASPVVGEEAYQMYYSDDPEKQKLQQLYSNKISRQTNRLEDDERDIVSEPADDSVGRLFTIEKGEALYSREDDKSVQMSFDRADGQLNDIQWEIIQIEVNKLRSSIERGIRSANEYIAWYDNGDHISKRWQASLDSFDIGRKQFEEGKVPLHITARY